MEKKLLNLKAKIQGIINTSEYRSKKLNGVLCSRADLEITELYIDTYIKQGSFNSLMKPCGATKELLDKLGII